MSAFLMPSLGADMDAGTLVEQLKSSGDTVKHGEVVAAVETQKGVIEIEAFQDGILEKWLVDIGSEVPVGTPLANIRAADEQVLSGPAGQPEAPTPGKPEVPQPHDPHPAPDLPEDPAPQDPSPQPAGPEFPMPDLPEPEIEWPEDTITNIATVGQTRERITPAARRRAAQAGFDLSSLGARKSGTTITREDISALVETPRADPLPDMRGAIAAAMSRSKREIPHYYLSHQADLTNADAFVAKTNSDRAPDDRLLLGALFLKAIALAVIKVPEMNGHYENNSFNPSKAIHPGLAISMRGGGLVAPALLDVASLKLDELMRNMRDLVTRVRAGRFRSRELSNATITLTSLGDRGVDQLYGVIYPPQVAIVGIGTPSLRPWVYEGQVVPRLVADITLAADHRASDGRRGALFLKAIAEKLNTPEAL
ncbi:2-oxo acid dehydrogenase subunit E2 (plasmid) [Sulfitobacter sp. SK012]|uniref:dihydrolipoamide acetyltransferase family protein n=1 Tax=Sulfitobacter sp. SK012 TaxID=1389005 RepID=UPI000E0C438D|nr:dihydrolipoamide acetyltransferase family protein [Sulfitobacter sp. SK012]AXI49172.1 2-oxo acid dehydrogenase subunit E2 [Sulfitobacter sp. SK012]